jgi:hypothetical protein
MRSRWLNELGFLALQALVEVLPLWLLVTLLQHNAGMLTGVSFAHAWALQLAASVPGRRLSRLQLPAALRFLLLVAAGLMLLVAAQPLFASPSDHGALPWLLAGSLCVRGLFMGANLDRPGAVLHWFKLGSGSCALLLAFIALSGTPRAELPYDQLRSLSIAYLFGGALLSGLHQRRTTLASAALTPAALVSVLGPTLILVLCSVLLVFGPKAAGWVVREGVATVSHAASLLQSALSVLGTWLVAFLRWFAGLFEPVSGTRTTPHAPITHGPPGMWNTVVRYRTIALRADDSEVVAVLVLLLTTFVLLHALFHLARRRSRTPAAAPEVTLHEEQHTTLSLQQLLQPLGRLLRRQPKRTLPLTAAELSPLREVYRALLSWAARDGRAREPSTTPHELAEQLAAQHPDKGRALSELTDLYAIERYAERPCTDAEQERARTLLHELTR